MHWPQTSVSSGKHRRKDQCDLEWALFRICELSQQDHFLEGNLRSITCGAPPDLANNLDVFSSADCLWLPTQHFAVGLKASGVSRHVERAVLSRRYQVQAICEFSDVSDRVHISAGQIFRFIEIRPRVDSYSIAHLRNRHVARVVFLAARFMLTPGGARVRHSRRHYVGWEPRLALDARMPATSKILSWSWPHLYMIHHFATPLPSNVGQP